MIGKPQGNIRGLKYRPDPTRPGGGVFVAHGKSKREDFRDLPAGTVVLSQGVSDEENEGEELEAAAEVSSSSAAAPASSSSSFVMGRRRSRTDDSVQSHSPSTESIPSTSPLLPASSVFSSSLARKRVGGSGPRSGVAGVGVGDGHDDVALLQVSFLDQVADVGLQLVSVEEGREPLDRDHRFDDVRGDHGELYVMYQYITAHGTFHHEKKTCHSEGECKQHVQRDGGEDLVGRDRCVRCIRGHRERAEGDQHYNIRA